MSIARKIFLLTGIVMAGFSAFGYFFWYQPKFNPNPAPDSFEFETKKKSTSSETMARITRKASLAKTYLADHGLNTVHIFLLDMRIPSGKKRFFIYNLLRDSVEYAGLVTHGSGSEKGGDDLEFSNIPNSHSTSLGKYRIGKAYQGSFGLAYKLYGLDHTNNKAFERFVVLHGHNCVPNEEVYPLQICLSYGCPTVSPPFLNTCKEYIDKSVKSILLWIYY